MSKYRNITDRELYLPHLDRAVQPDEVVDAGDDDMTWPETLWSSVATPRTKKGD